MTVSDSSNGSLPDRAGAPDDLEPIVCDMSAIPLRKRFGHVMRARSLFFARGRVRRELEDGLEVDLGPELLGDAAKFIENERLCCRHLAFDLHVPPRGGLFTLRVTGPGAREELAALTGTSEARVRRR